MSFELAFKKAGVPLIRSFIQSVQGVLPALPSQVQKRNQIGYKFKTLKDGKVVNMIQIDKLQDAFTPQGDKK